MKHFFLLFISLLALTAHAELKVKGLMDYSYCGYHASEDSIPLVPVKAYVACAGGDMAATLQEAIDYVSSLPADQQGVHGAVLLGPGVFEVKERLVIGASGVVLRGSGREATVLRKLGVDRGSLIRIEGENSKKGMGELLQVTQQVKPGTQSITIEGEIPASWVGREVEIVRKSSAPWIESVGCRTFGGGIDALGWKPGDVDLHWRRTVTAVENHTLQLDAPLTMGFDPLAEASYKDNKGRINEHVPFSPCTVQLIEHQGEIKESGIENLTLESDYDKSNSHDENHCWTGISIENASDCWVRQVNFKHLAGSGVIMQPTARRVTVEDCLYLEPVSENAGLRRTSFYILGQQCLVQRCFSRQGRHDFVTGYGAAGPNAFVQCEAAEALSYSGGLGFWSCGTLYDIVDIDGHDLVMKNLGQDNHGAGWNTASSVAWQCTAAEIHCYSPDTINQNRAYGSWAQFSGNGVWESSNSHVQPRSLYYAQLEERLGDNLKVQPRILYRSTDASSSPTVEKAMLMASEARNVPRQTLKEWIVSTPALAIDMPVKGVKHFAKRNATSSLDSPAPIEIVKGHLSHQGELLLGKRYQTPWWNGSLRQTYLKSNGCNPALTRFVPDREGTGLTDRIDSVVAWAERENILAWDQNYGLWYDRRRDDHERIRRRDAAVWAPFWEQPWAQTGEGQSWNGLSLYDLTRNNTWYYDRLHQYAQKVAPKGKLLYLEHYFQHNILEAGAHWVDAPWRPVNNVNGTVFPEPVPFTGDKRVFVAEWFYDEQNETMADLHRQYIRRNLEAFSDLPNVIHYISEEYTGPLHFTRFWVETIRDWERETGKQVLVALAATKDVQDSILTDPSLAPTIDIIDIRYWHYKSKPDPGTRKTWDDGKDIFDPAGGVNLAPRQHARQQPVGKVAFKDAYRSVSEYRTTYPDKAVVYYAQNYPDMAWAVVMAGGSAAELNIADSRLRNQLTGMEIEGSLDRVDAKILRSEEALLVYGLTEESLTITNLNPSKYLLSEIDRSKGSEVGKPQAIQVKNGNYQLNIKPNHIYWLRKK